jgi:hypothetical protein
MKLTEGMSAVLSALRDGVPLGRAVTRAGKGEDVMAWFRSWAGDGLFTGVKFGR